MTPTRTTALGLSATLSLAACSHDAPEAVTDADARTHQRALFRTSGRTLSALPERNMGFGSAVAIDGDTIVTGAPGANGSQGLAYTIVESTFTPGQWLQDEAFGFSDAMGNELGGTSLALRDGTFVVGAPNADVGGVRTGTSYVFSTSGASPAELRSDAFDEERFGEAAAILRDTIFVGAPLTRPEGFTGSPGPGVVYVFTRQAGAASWGDVSTWDYTLAAPDRAVGDAFGSALSASESHAAVGAPDQGLGIKPGAVYVFAKVDGDWFTAGTNEPTKLKEAAGGPAAGDGSRFGASVRLQGDSLLVGAPGAAPDGQGIAILYTRTSGNTWEVAHRFENPNPEPNSEFGAAVGMDGRRVIVGAPGATDGGEPLGLAYVFELDGAEGWSAPQTLRAAGATPSTGSPGSARFGQAVAIQGGRAVVGAPSAREDVNGAPDDNVGAVYVFTFDDSPIEPDAGVDSGTDAGVDVGADASTPTQDTGPDASGPEDTGATPGDVGGEEDTGQEVDAGRTPPRARPRLTTCATGAPGAPSPAHLAWITLLAMLGVGRRRVW